MSAYFSYIRRNRTKIIDSFGSALKFCLALSDNSDCVRLPAGVHDILKEAEPDDRDYAIASTYALLIGDSRRKELSAYFTPPVLARAALEACAPFLHGIEDPAVLDPACGGGSFLTPIARHLITQKCQQGLAAKEVCRNILKNIQGIEIDSGLATLSETLLRNMLLSEHGFLSKGSPPVVRCADALSEPQRKKYDLVVGNPPFGRVRNKVDKLHLKKAGLANIGGHTNFYSLFLLRGLDWVKPGGGLIFVLPTSFVAGPYFAGLRQEVLNRAKVIRIDLHEQRENLFLGAVQDVCLLTLRRRDTDERPADGGSEPYQLGFVDAGGKRSCHGMGNAKAGGEPWMLPVANQVRPFIRRNHRSKSCDGRSFVLSDYGFAIRVGKVVPTRERERLHTKRQKGDFPLVWASSIRPDGSFDFSASKRLGNAPWYSPPRQDRIRYATIKPSIVIQRTSNRDQVRRLNAATVPKHFRDQYKRGFVAENHVIVLEAVKSRPAVSPSKLAAILNSGVVNERFSAVSGSFSVSAKLLQRMALPDPELIKELDTKNLEHGLRQLFDGLGEVLAPVDSPDTAGDSNDAVDKPCNLNGRLPVDQNTRLKRRAVA